MSRIALSAPTTFHIRNGGSDSSGNGSVVKPWATPQYAADLLRYSYDLRGQPVTIDCADPNHNQQVYPGLSIDGPWLGAGGGGPQVKFKGDTLYSNGVVFRPTSGNPLSVNNRGSCTLENIELDGVNVHGNDLINATTWAWVELVGGRFSNAGNSTECANIITADSDAFVSIQPGTYWVIGPFSANAMFYATDYGKIRANTNGVPNLVMINHNGNPIFNQGYATVFNGVVQMEAVTFNGGCMGPKFAGILTGEFDTYTGPVVNLDYFPGNVAGKKDALVAYR